MFMQGTTLPPPNAGYVRRPRRPSFQRPLTPDAQRLRLLLRIVDARRQAECTIRNLVQVTTAAAIQAALQQALYNAYIRVQCLLQSTTKDIISNVDAPNRFQRFMGGATSFLQDTSSSQQKFEALESELKMLKEQMALLMQGQANVSSVNAASNLALTSVPPCPLSMTIPAPPPAPPCPPSMMPIHAPPSSCPASVPQPACPAYSEQAMLLLDELICSDISDSEGDDSDFDSKCSIRGEGIPPQPPVRSSLSRLRNSSEAWSQRRPTFAEQIQERNRVGLRKTRIDRSPGGTPLKRNSIPGSDGFHQEILANALFRKFQNVRADESPERRPTKKQERQDSLDSSNGLASLFEGEVQDDEWSDKENS